MVSIPLVWRSDSAVGVRYGQSAQAAAGLSSAFRTLLHVGPEVLVRAVHVPGLENGCMAVDVKQIGERVSRESEVLQRIRNEIGRVIVGQEALVDRLLLALLCNNHVLIEGVPGLAKTLTVTTLAKAIRASFHRIQFTPDLLPADVIGTMIYNPKSGEFSTKRGPVFANIILADEINRAPAKVQSALLEAMQERHVTIGDETFFLDDPFMVLATQNPIEQEGTYPLPEAQVDRFMFKLKVSYPNRVDELKILRRMAASAPDLSVSAVLEPADIRRLRELTDDIFMDEKIEEYIVSVVEASRQPDTYGLKIGELIRYGASPRATIYLAMAAKGHALLEGRGYVTPQDVKSVAMDVLRHRVVITYEAEAEEKTSEDIVQQILDSVDVP
jgi:MoxR-like ATPase